MPDLVIRTKSLTTKEVRELTEELRGMGGVESANYRPDVVGKVRYRSVFAAIPEFYIVLRFVETAALGIGIEAGRHLYKKVGEALVDKTFAWFESRFTNASAAEVEATLYGPDDKPIKKISRKR